LRIAVSVLVVVFVPRVANIPAIRRCVRHVIPFTQVVAESSGASSSTLLTSFCTTSSGFALNRAAATFIGRAATTFVCFSHGLFLI